MILNSFVCNRFSSSRCGEDDPEVMIPGVRTAHHYVAVNIKGRTLGTANSQATTAESQQMSVESQELQAASNNVVDERGDAPDVEDAVTVAEMPDNDDDDDAPSSSSSAVCCPCGIEGEVEGGLLLKCRRCLRRQHAICFVVFSEAQVPKDGHLCHVCVGLEGGDPIKCTDPVLARRFAKNRPITQTCMYRQVLAKCVTKK